MLQVYTKKNRNRLETQFPSGSAKEPPECLSTSGNNYFNVGSATNSRKNGKSAGASTRTKPVS